MGNFLDGYKIPKLNQDQINLLNSPIITKEIEAVIKSLPKEKKKKKGPGPDGFSAEFYQTFKEDLIPIFFKLFHKIETEGTLPSSFYEAIVTLVPKPHKDPTRWRWNGFCLIRNFSQFPFIEDFCFYFPNVKIIIPKACNDSCQKH
jgi:hypothetical protein